MVRAAGVSKKSLCPDCGTELSREPWAAGLCPHCLVELALGDTSLEAKLLVDPRGGSYSGLQRRGLHRGRDPRRSLSHPLTLGPGRDGGGVASL